MRWQTRMQMTGKSCKYDFIILTDNRNVKPYKTDWYIENVLNENPDLIPVDHSHIAVFSGFAIIG